MWFRLPYAWAIALLDEWEEHPPVQELAASLLRAFGMLPPRRPRDRRAAPGPSASPARELSRDEVIAELMAAGFRA